MILLAGLWLLSIGLLVAQPAQAQAAAPLHPTFKLLDETGENVLKTGNPVSTMQTCGACHDTAFIASHSFHTDVGLSATTAPGKLATGHPWDTSPGYFGQWNALTYRYLSPDGDARIDLTTPAWIEVMGARQVGGGPAVTSRSGTSLLNLGNKASVTDTQIVDASGQLVAWDWKTSGVEEMNCFLCHIQAPNNAARIAALKAGRFQWANSATLLGTDIVSLNQSGDKLTWNAAAFDETGALLPKYITVQDPRSENCGQCHGLVNADAQTPLTLTSLDTTAWGTLTTGQIISPQRLMNSGLNLESKATLSRTWDVHAERVVSCTNCHYALNNPVYYQDSSTDRPSHLIFDPRRLDLGDYLYRPLHQFAKGEASLAPEFNNSLRRCESCHSAEVTHNWLPYKDRHMTALNCETCHIPRLYGPALQSVDWTILNTDSTPQYTYRGTENGAPVNANTLIKGFDPVLLPRNTANGSTSLAPFNLVSAWYWVYGGQGAQARPVPLRDLQAVYLDGTNYRADILAAFDANKDGKLDDKERFIDTQDQQALIARLLAARSLDNPRIVGETQPYSLNHDVATGEWAIRECHTCHGETSRINQSMLLSSRAPGAITPAFVNGTIATGGAVQTTDSGALYFNPESSAPPNNLYVFGHDAVYWIDWLGILFFFGTCLGVVAHGGLRFVATRRLKLRTAHDAAPERVYMYSVYERLWHWLQTALIIGLLLTGIIVHKPDKFGALSFSFIVQVHNILAVILVINAALAAFYHLVSGEIRQFLPKPHGFFNDAIEQAIYYLRGIFRGAPHPFQKTRDRKMNPIQQVTYLVILNVLLPLQVITGALMWGAQQFPNIAQSLGGLPLLAPLHTLAAWSFGSFIVLHVYLTTTGPKPFSYIKAMMMGWEEAPAHQPESEVKGEIES
jgi:thiosulfate reductase cytochrome b subunit